MLLAIRNLSKSYGVVTVLNKVSFTVNANERIGIVGSNGVGKSTLLRILMNQEEMDTGTIKYAPLVEVGYLPQTTPDFYGRTINDLLLESLGNLRQIEERMHLLEADMAIADADQLSELLDEYNVVSTRFQDRGGYNIDHRIDAILEGLHLTYLPRTREVNTLSGGEKERLGLATLLLRSPDLLLLDEPTNHLDVSMLEWFEQYLSSYTGAALIVSHDRQFLNRTVNVIFEIDEHEHHLKRYEGNYDAYMQQKAQERQKWMEDYERQQEEIQELRKRIKDTARDVGHNYRAPRDNDKYAVYFFDQQKQRAVSRNVRAAEEQLRRIEEDLIPKPPELLHITSRFQNEEMASQEVIVLAHVSKSFDERMLFDDLNLIIGSNARILLTGPNGAGKTTLLKIMMSREQPNSGEVRLSPSIRIGYLAQEPENFDLDKTVIETYRYGQVGYEGEFIGKLLGYGFFRLEDMQKKVRQLSVGQRRKLEIARLIAERPNVLLLDEPTNYISLDVLEAFEYALHDFAGPIIAISHDRRFIEHFGGTQWRLIDGTFLNGNNIAMIE